MAIESALIFIKRVKQIDAMYTIEYYLILKKCDFTVTSLSQRIILTRTMTMIKPK